MNFVNFKSFANKILNRWEIKRGEVHLKSKPVELGIEPTNKCNSNCIMCNRQFSRMDENLAAGLINWELLKQCTNYFKSSERVCFSGFGEPGLHMRYVEMAEYIKSQGPYIYCFTNGTLLQENIIEELVRISFDEICISIGGGGRETHKYIRGIDNFNQIIDGLELLNEYKKRYKSQKPLATFNVVAMNTVINEIDKVLELAIKTGVSTISMPNLSVQGREMEEETPWLNVKESHKQFEKIRLKAVKQNISFRFPILKQSVGDCIDFFSYIFITWDGKVLSCPFERFIMGDLKKAGLDEIWNSASYRSLRKKYYAEGISTVCPGCSAWDNRMETFLNPYENSRRRAIDLHD